jgi:hypothetical protein
MQARACTWLCAQAHIHARAHTHTHTRTQLCNIYCFSTATIIPLRTSVLRYTYKVYTKEWYIACLVFSNKYTLTHTHKQTVKGVLMHIIYFVLKLSCAYLKILRWCTDILNFVHVVLLFTALVPVYFRSAFTTVEPCVTSC